MRRRFNNRGIALAGSVLIMLVFGILLGALAIRSEMLLTQTNTRMDSHQAFYAAETGLDRIISELRRNPSWRTTDLVYGPDDDATNERIALMEGGDIIGYYSLDLMTGGPAMPGINNAGQQFWVRSTGFDAISQSGETRENRRSIVAALVVTNPARFGVSTLGDLNIDSGATIDFDILARDITFNVDTSLPGPEQQINVNAEINYLRSVSGEGQPQVNVDPADINAYPSVTFPGVDLAKFEDLATNTSDPSSVLVIDGDATVNLNDPTGFGGPTPELILVRGDATVSGEYNDSMIVVATGNINIGGDVTAFDTGDPSTDPQIGLLASGDIIIPESTNNLDLEGFLMADGQASGSKGVVEAQGLNKGDLNFYGSISARGNGISGDESAINLSGFNNRNYVFNQELVNNQSIPFLPFIANVAIWGEVNPNDTWPITAFNYQDF
jgi:hypothetical protein